MAHTSHDRNNMFESCYIHHITSLFDKQDNDSNI
jgi:hypothetical protein